MVKTYICAYLGAMVLAVILTPVVIRIARLLNIVDEPDARKVHVRPLPRIGGVAIFLAMLGALAPILCLDSSIEAGVRQVRWQLAAMIAAGAVMLATGLADDVRSLRARTKLAVQLAVALGVCAAGIRIMGVSFGQSFSLEFGWLSWPVTVFWIVGLTNAVNLSDGLDGLAAGIASITCAVIMVYAIHISNLLMAVVMVTLLGSLSGFLCFNFNPARIFMGDSGSLFVGTMLATSSVLCAAKTATAVGLALPVVALGIPIFDTFFSMLRRFLQRRSLFAPDRSHFHHRLLAMGLRQRHVVVTAYVLTLAATGMAMFMLYTDGAQTMVIFGLILLLFVLAFRAVGSVRLRETVEAIRRRHTIESQYKREITDFERLELHFRHARGFEEWWEAVCLAAEEMDFMRGQMRLTNRDGSERLLVWRSREQDTDTPVDDSIRLTIPIADRRSGPGVNLQIDVSSRHSLESAGHRLTLFSRLAESYPIANLIQ